MKNILNLIKQKKHAIFYNTNALKYFNINIKKYN